MKYMKVSKAKMKSDMRNKYIFNSGGEMQCKMASLVKYIKVTSARIKWGIWNVHFDNSRATAAPVSAGGRFYGSMVYQANVEFNNMITDPL